MKVLYLNHNVVRSGTYIRAAHLAREVVAAGHEVTLVTTSRDRRRTGHEWEWDGVRIVEAPDLLTGPGRTGWDPWNTIWRIRRLAREPFDLIHAFDSRPAVIFPALAVRRQCGAPLFLDWADWWGRGGTIQERSGWAVRTFFSPVETWFEEAFRTDATAHTAIVASLRDRCAGLGVDPARIKWLPNGCQPPAHARVARAEARRHLGLPEAPLLLHVGVAFPADAAFLFDAFRRVRQAVPIARLALVGRYRGDVPADLRPCVVRTGFVEDAVLAQWLAAADVGLLVLRDTIASRGRWPGKLSDYLTGGVPLVMPQVGAAAEYIAAAGAARLSQPVPADFAQSVIDLLHDPDAQASLSRRARELASSELSWSAIARQLLAFYGEWSAAVPTTGADDSRVLATPSPTGPVSQ
jgi:glycosyltransferase involved in cell wall biosynthesis